MGQSFSEQLEILHTDLIRLGALCEDAISSAVKGLIDENIELREKAIQLEREIDDKERDIEDFCYRLIRRKQPVASDLWQINAALKLVTDMERIGDQAADIAEIAEFMVGSSVKSDVHIADMAKAAISMLNESVDSFVSGDVEKAKKVIASDDTVDQLFTKIKGELVKRISEDNTVGGECLDLLMIAKYLERIGDHATNIAEQVIYSVTGERGSAL